MAAIALGSTATVLGLAAAVTALKLADKDAVPIVVAAPGVAPAPAPAPAPGGAPAAATPAPGAPPAPPGAGPPPGGLPFGWESAIDPRYGLPYYYNRSTKETTWRPPPGEPNPFAGNPFASKQGVDRKVQLDAAVLDAKKPKEAPPTPGPTPAPASPPAPGLPGVPPGPPGVPGVDRKAQLDAALNGDVPQPPPVPGSPPAPGLPPPVGGPAPYRPRPLGAPLGPRGSLGIPGRPVLPLGGPRPAPNVAGLPGAAPAPGPAPGDTPVPFVPPAPNVAGLPGAAPAPGPAPGDTPVLPAPNVAAPVVPVPITSPMGGITIPIARGQGPTMLGPGEQVPANDSSVIGPRGQAAAIFAEAHGHPTSKGLLRARQLRAAAGPAEAGLGPGGLQGLADLPSTTPAPSLVIPGLLPTPVAAGPAPGAYPVLPDPNVAGLPDAAPGVWPRPRDPARPPPLGGIAVPMAQGQGASVLGPGEQADAIFAEANGHPSSRGLLEAKKLREAAAKKEHGLAWGGIQGLVDLPSTSNGRVDQAIVDRHWEELNADFDRIEQEKRAKKLPGIGEAAVPLPPAVGAEALSAADEERARQLRATPRALLAPIRIPGRGTRRTRRNLPDIVSPGSLQPGEAALGEATLVPAPAAAPHVAAVPGVISAPPPPPPKYNINAEEWKPAVQQQPAADLQAQAAVQGAISAPPPQYNINAEEWKPAGAPPDEPWAVELTRQTAQLKAAREAREAAGAQLPAPPEPIDEAALRAEADAEIAAGLEAVSPPPSVVIPENEVNVAPPVQAPNPLGSLREQEIAAARTAAAMDPPGDRLYSRLTGEDITPEEPYDRTQRMALGMDPLSYVQKVWLIKKYPSLNNMLFGGRHKTHRRRRRRARGGMDAETRKKKIDAIATRLLLEAAKKQRAAEEAAKAAKAAVKARSNFQKEGQVKK